MPLIVREFGQRPYHPVWQDMQHFTDQRNETTADELWLLQHAPVFTLGKNGKPEHIRDPGSIPVIQSDRGGQVTYHGPGQIVVYTLLDLKRMNIGVRELVTRIENAVIGLLQDYAVEASARRDAPGVYVDGRKIAALGLRVRKGCSFHGLALNVDMDLAPFSQINPCGYQGLEVTQLTELADIKDFGAVEQQLLSHLKRQFL
ncbi:MAG: lipoyl(octanoyl) transferase LipB [Gammaproteobacteria bacterium]|nr:lipoyl(octanoyl) transferase LipB [Gammaproteobacteria bacterium]NNL07283.1 lipoyl(octanoyl) transferase LipB [Gammaproteobacteria bacterium]